MNQTARKLSFPTRPLRGRKRVNSFFSIVISQRIADLLAADETLTIKAIAENGGLTYAQLHYYSKPRTFLPRPRVFFGIAKALGLTAEEMFEAAYYTRPKR